MPETIWQEVAPGLDFCMLQTPQYCKSGSPENIVLRIHPEKWSFKTYHFGTLPVKERIPCYQWREVLGVPLVINAGQYTEDYTHLGWLISNGKNLGTRQHPIWKGLFASEPLDKGLPYAQIIDLNDSPTSLVTFRYSEAIQSLMLFDIKHEIRVNRTPNQARRSIIAEDYSGNILLFVSKGEYTLWDYATMLLQSRLDLKQAMSLDGGSQAQIAFSFTNNEMYYPLLQIPLPAILAISPR